MNFRIAFAIAAAGAPGVAAGDVSSVTLPAWWLGWYQSDGSAGTTGNFTAGQTSTGQGLLEDHRDWFAYDLHNVHDVIVGARLYMPFFHGVISPTDRETLTLREVTTSLNDIASGRGGTAAYADLGDGTAYGSREFLVAESGLEVYIELNAEFVARANLARGTRFAFGGHVTSLDGSAATREQLFPGSGGPGAVNQVQLILDLVPTPGSAVALLPALLWMGRRRR